MNAPNQVPDPLATLALLREAVPLDLLQELDFEPSWLRREALRFAALGLTPVDGDTIGTHDSVRALVLEPLGEEEVRDRHARLVDRLDAARAEESSLAGYARRRLLDHAVLANDLERIDRLVRDDAFLAAMQDAAGVDATIDALARARDVLHGDDVYVEGIHAAVALVHDAIEAAKESLRLRPDDLYGILYRHRLAAGETPSGPRPYLQGTRVASATEPHLEPAEVRLRRVVVARDQIIAVSDRGSAVHWGSDGASGPIESDDRDIRVAATQPDGGLVTGHADGAIVYVASGIAATEVTRHQAAVTTLFVLPRDAAVVSGAEDGTVRVVVAATNPALVLTGHSGPITCLGGTDVKVRVVVSGSQDGTLRAWDLDTGRLRAVLRGHSGAVTCCAVGEDGAVLSGGNDRTLRAWRPDGTPLAVIGAHDKALTACAFVDERRAISASEDGTLKRFDLETGEEQVRFAGHRGAVVGFVGLAPDRVVSWSLDGTVRAWDVDDGRELSVFAAAGGPILAATSTDDQRLVVVTGGRRPEVVRLSGLSPSRRPILAVAATSERILSSTDTAPMRLWNDTEQKTSRLEHRPPLRIATNPGGDFFVSVGGDHHVRYWRLDGATDEAHDLKAVTPAVPTAIALSPRGVLTLIGLDDGTAFAGRRIWVTPPSDDPDPDPYRRLEVAARVSGHAGPVRALACDGAERVLLTGSDDGTARVFALQSGTPLHVLRGHGESVLAVAITGDGARGLTASRDGTLRYWDLEGEGELLALLDEHRAAVTGCAFLPDERYAVTCSLDATALLWDLEEKPKRVETFTGDAALRCLSVAGRRPAFVVGDDAGELWRIEVSLPAGDTHDQAPAR